MEFKLGLEGEGLLITRSAELFLNPVSTSVPVFWKRHPNLDFLLDDDFQEVISKCVLQLISESGTTNATSPYSGSICFALF